MRAVIRNSVQKQQKHIKMTEVAANEIKCVLHVHPSKLLMHFR